MFVDAIGRRLELITLDRCDGRGPQAWIRVSRHDGILLGDGYYRCLDSALAHVDARSLVEVIPLRPDRVQP